MAIDPTAAGRPSTAHVSLLEAGQIARQGAALGSSPGAAFGFSAAQLPEPGIARRPLAASQRSNTASRAFLPHTPVSTRGGTDPDRWDSLLNR
ncbi:MAG: hypothetical protein ACM3S1_12585, partial [Hyphomicrobiales bacterium]